jgi:hypothetical protein
MHCLLDCRKETQYLLYRGLARSPGNSGWVQKIMSIEADANLFAFRV